MHRRSLPSKAAGSVQTVADSRYTFIWVLGEKGGLCQEVTGLESYRSLLGSQLRLPLSQVALVSGFPDAFSFGKLAMTPASRGSSGEKERQPSTRLAPALCFVSVRFFHPLPITSRRLLPGTESLVE